MTSENVDLHQIVENKGQYLVTTSHSIAEGQGGVLLNLTRFSNQITKCRRCGFSGQG